MGGTCTKLVFVKDRNTSKVIHRNKVNAVFPSNEITNVKDTSIENTKTIRSPVEVGGNVESQCNNQLSKGDHCRNSTRKITTKTDGTVLAQADFSKGDHIPGKQSNKGNDNLPVKNAYSTGNGSTGDNLKMSNQTMSVESQNPSEQNSSENKDVKDSNANSRHVSVIVVKENHTSPPCNENENKSNKANTKKNENREAESYGALKRAAENELHAKESTKDDPTETEDDSTENSSSQPSNADPILQDSLTFFPLNDGEKPQRPPTACYIPERLQAHKSRKPPLSYDERMLLADLNRFQELDKKREFAVRRNRFIKRIGKLPKINSDLDATLDSSNKSLNTSDNL